MGKRLLGNVRQEANTTVEQTVEDHEPKERRDYENYHAAGKIKRVGRMAAAW